MDDAAPASRPAPDAPSPWPDLRAWLAANPAHLLEDHELLAALGLKVQPGNVVEFGPRAVGRLQRVVRREADRRRALEVLARDNLVAQAQTHVSALDLMDARHHTDLALRLDAACQARFGLVGATVALERPGGVPVGWHALDQGRVAGLLGVHGLSRLGEVGDAADLFGADGGQVASVALVRMAPWAGARQGLVAFGSGDPDGFGPHMGCELVAFLTRVVERMAERWPVMEVGP